VLGDCQGFMWQNGVMINLNDPDHLIPGFNGFIINAQDINDDGEITGRAFDPATGDIKAFIAIPVSVSGASSKNKTQSTARAKVVLPPAVRQTILRERHLGNALLR
jgi:hypothetical protein